MNVILIISWMVLSPYLMYGMVVKNYYAEVCRAEMAILELRFNEAHKIYTHLASGGQVFFLKDLQNALICAIRVMDFETCELFTRLLISKGVDQSYFDQQEFAILKNQPWWSNLTVFPKNSVQSHKMLIDKLHAKDQWARKNSEDNIGKIDSISAKFLEDSVFVKGIPREEIIGIWQNEKGAISLLQPNFIVLLIHQLRIGNNKLLNELKNAVTSGQFENWKLLFISNVVSSIGDYFKFGCLNGSIIVSIDGSCYSCADVEDIDANRKKYFLPSVQKTREMMEMYQKNKLELKNFVFPILDISYCEIELGSKTKVDTYTLEKGLTHFPCL